MKVLRQLQNLLFIGGMFLYFELLALIWCDRNLKKHEFFKQKC